MSFTKKTNAPDLVERWPYSFQDIDQGDPLYEYLDGLATELRNIDVLIDELYDQRFVESATGRELEKLGAEVDVTRRDSENDDELRFRVRVGKAVAASDGTPENIQNILSLIFTDTQLSNITVEDAAGDPVTQFIIPSPYFDDVPYTRAQLESLLEDAFPCGFGVEVVFADTWRLGESGQQGIGEGGLL